MFERSLSLWQKLLNVISGWRYSIWLLRLSITCRLKNSKLNQQMCFFTIISQVFSSSPSIQLHWVHCDPIFEHSSDNETVQGSSRKLRGATKHLIDNSEKRTCRLSFEFYSPHVIEKCSKIASIEFAT